MAFMSENPSDTPAPEKEGTLQTLKDKSLKTAGVAYLIGDAAMFGAGLLENDYGGAFGGATWALGSLAAARYGNPTAEKQLKLLTSRLNEYLKKQGIEVPENPTTATLSKEGGVIEHIEKFLYANPSQVLNAIYAVGGMTTAFGGFKKDMKADAAKGLLVTAGGLAGLLIPEKKLDPKHPPHDPWGKMWSWIQEKPLRVSGLLYHANNAVSVYGIYEKWGKQVGKSKTNLYLRAITASSFIFANTMLALSSKGHGASNNTDQLTGKLAEESTHIIAAQPKEVREALVQNIAGYLSAQPEIKLKATEIVDLLHTKLAAVQQRQPVMAGSWQQRVEHTSDPALSPTL